MIGFTTALGGLIAMLAVVGTATAMEVELPTGSPRNLAPGDAPAGVKDEPVEPTATTVKLVPLRTLRMRSRGEYVRDLQKALRKRRILVRVDGTFGRGTRRGVRIVQKRKKLRATGVATVRFQRRLGIRPRKLTVPVSGGAATPVTEGVFAAFPVARGYSYSNDYGAPRSQGSHQGIDIIAPRGIPIYAVNDGVVDRLSRAEQGLGGRYVWQKGTDGTTEYYYAHMDSIAAGLDAGDRVSAGQVIGTVGNTGDARFGVHHLHFEWRPKGRSSNPYPHLIAADPTKSPPSAAGR